MNTIITRRKFLLFPIVFLLGFAVHSVNAGHGGIFVLEPNQEITDSIYLTVSSEAIGTVLSNSSLPIDFWITDPSGVMLLRYDRFENASFKFVANENGNYTMHLRNAYQNQNITVTLDYSVNFVLVLQSNVNLKFSVDSERSVVTSPPPPPPDDNTPDLDNLYENYLNFQRASEILRTLKNGWKYLPIRGLVFVSYCFALVVGPIEIIRRRQPATS